MYSDPDDDDLEIRSSVLAKLRANTYSTEALKLLPPPEPLVDGLLFLDSLVMLFGPSGQGKSFVAIDWALSVATGRDWCGKPVTSGRVIYVSAEGRGGLGQRVTAWERAREVYDGSEHDQIDWILIPVNLFDEKWVDAFVEMAADTTPSLVILDTLNMCSIGSDENSAKDMGIILEGARRIRSATGACVLIVHHTGKDTGRGARGHSALKAAVDTEIECSAKGAAHTLKVTKQRDAIPLSPIGLVRRSVADSCVMELGSVEVGEVRLTDREQQALDALRQISKDGPVRSKEWEAAAPIPVDTLNKVKKKLAEIGRIVNTGTTSKPLWAMAGDCRDPMLPSATPKGGGSGRQ